MPIYVQECGCGHVFEDIRALHAIDPNPACPQCSGPTTRILRPHTNSSYVDPVIVFQAPDGTLRFPGMGESRSTTAYEKMGFRRHEIRGAFEMRRFEGQMNQRERSIMARKIEQRQRGREARESAMRRELRSHMERMTPLGRDLARAAMRHNDHKPREQSSDPGFHSEVYSNDRSNRERSRGNDGRRHRD